MHAPVGKFAQPSQAVIIPGQGGVSSQSVPASGVYVQLERHLIFLQLRGKPQAVLYGYGMVSLGVPEEAWRGFRVYSLHDGNAR